MLFIYSLKFFSFFLHSFFSVSVFLFFKVYLINVGFCDVATLSKYELISTRFEYKNETVIGTFHIWHFKKYVCFFSSASVPHT